MMQPSSQELVALLDPERDYGERSYQDVLDAVSNGSLRIMAGVKLPRLIDTSNGRAVKGSGQPPQEGMSRQMQALHAFRELALDDVDDAYRELRRGMRGGDPRFHKIYWENLVGKVGEMRGGDAMGEAFKVLIDMLAKPEERTVIIDQ